MNIRYNRYYYITKDDIDDKFIAKFLDVKQSDIAQGKEPYLECNIYESKKIYWVFGRLDYAQEWCDKYNKKED